MSFLKNRIHSFKNAFRGVFVFFTKWGGAHAKIHLILGLAVIAAGIYFQITPPEWLAILTAIGLVILSEMLNTAIELIMDLFHPEKHIKVRNIKDIAAGAVLFSVFIAIIIGWLVFWDYFC